MTRYLMIVLLAVVFVVGNGCDSAVSSLEEDEAHAVDARWGVSPAPLTFIPEHEPKEEADEGAECTNYETCDFEGESDECADYETCEAENGGNDDRARDDGGAVAADDDNGSGTGAVTDGTSNGGDVGTVGGWTRPDEEKAFTHGDVEGLRRLPDGQRAEVAAIFSVSSIIEGGGPAEGSFSLKNNKGEWYQAHIQHLRVDHDGTATFSGPITASNPAFLVPAWMFVKVTDGGASGEDSFVYQVGEEPEDGGEDILPDENGEAVQLIGGDIIVSTGPSGFAEDR